MSISKEIKDIEHEIEVVSNVYPMDEDTIDYLQFLFKRKNKLLILTQD